MNKREIWLELGMLGILAAGVLVFFWPAVLQQGTFFVQDVMVQNYPFRHFFAQALKSFSLPLWNPAINCGFPLFAEGQAGILYPFNLLTALLLPTYAALNYNIVLHLWLAGAGTYLLLRAIGTVRAAALSGGLTYACSGYLVIRAMSPNFVDVSAWMPFLFALVELSLRRRRLVFMPLAGLVVGLQLLAGHPQAAVYGLLAGMMYGIYRGLLQRAGWGFFVWVVLGVPLVGLGLGAVQILPTAELVHLSARGTGVSWEQFVNMSLPPERLITLLLPNFFGNSGSGSYWGREAGFFIQLCAYVGIVPLLLALVALKERRDAHTGFFCALCGLGLLLSLGRFNSIFTLLYEVPGLNFFRIPTRFLLWFAFGLAVLCGLGLDRVLARSGTVRRQGWWWASFLLLLLGGGMAWLNREVLIGGMVSLYGRELGIDLVRLVLLLGGGGWIITSRGGGRKITAIAVVAPLLVWGDLYSFGRDFNGLIEPGVYLETPASAKAILADAQSAERAPPRLLSLIAEKNTPYNWHGGWVSDPSSYRKYPETLRMYTGGLYGLANALPGWSPLHLRRHWEFMRGYPGFADLAGVEYMVSYQPLFFPGLTLVSAEEVKVYRNDRALPRAFMVGNFRVMKDARERLRYMKSDQFDPRDQVLLEEGLEWGGKPGEARIVRYEAEEVVVRLEEHRGGILVLSDTFYPGWKAFVDGVEKRILRANHVFRAVEVPVGAQEVLFRFASESFRVGAWVGSVCWLGFIALLMKVFRRELASLRPLRPESGSPMMIWTLQGLLIFIVHALVTRWPLWAQSLERSCVLSVAGG